MGGSAQRREAGTHPCSLSCTKPHSNHTRMPLEHISRRDTRPQGGHSATTENRRVEGKDTEASQAATHRVLSQGAHSEEADRTSGLGCILEAAP